MEKGDMVVKFSIAVERMAKNVLCSLLKMFYLGFG